VVYDLATANDQVEGLRHRRSPGRCL
jgi:hypothetical protein